MPPFTSAVWPDCRIARHSKLPISSGRDDHVLLLSHSRTLDSRPTVLVGFHDGSMVVAYKLFLRFLCFSCQILSQNFCHKNFLPKTCDRFSVNLRRLRSLSIFPSHFCNKLLYTYVCRSRIVESGFRNCEFQIVDFLLLIVNRKRFKSRN